MEMNREILLNALNSGVKAEDLANRFADELNAAIAQKEADDAKAAAEAAAKLEAEEKKNKKQARKLQDMEYIREEILDYLYEYYGIEMEDGYLNDIVGESAADWVDTLDELVKLITSPDWIHLINQMKNVKAIFTECFR